MTDKEKRIEELGDLRHVMTSAQGRRFVWRFLADAQIFGTCYTGNSQTYYNEGRREYALKYFADTQAMIDLYLLMVAENNPPETQHNKEN